MSWFWRFGFRPSDKRLLRWLEHGDGADPALDAYLATSDRCANRLEELAQPLPELGTALRQSLAGPDDLVARLGVRMNETIRNREDLSLVFELMGVPFATVRNLMEDDA
ncbi:MAG: hypothetical protein AAGA90_08435 [Actinomycetota bacterium]